VALIISPAATRFRNFRNWKAERYAVADYAWSATARRSCRPADRHPSRPNTVRPSSRSTPCSAQSHRPDDAEAVALAHPAQPCSCVRIRVPHTWRRRWDTLIGLYATTNRWRAAPYLSQEWVVDKYPQAVAQELGKHVEEVPWGTRVRHEDAMSLIEVSDVTERLDALMAARSQARG
jgi:heptosyltransferase I